MTAVLQPSLFDAGARTSDPDTSHIASQRDRATDRQRALLLHARHPDGLTDFELAALMDRQQTSAGKRRHEWTVRGGADRDYVVDSGRRRPAPSGSPAIVWQITPAGLERAA